MKRFQECRAAIILTAALALGWSAAPCHAEEDAIEIAKAAFEQNPDIGSADVLAGEFIKAKKTAEGLAYFHAPRGTSPREAAVHACARGNIHLALYDWKAALETYGEAASLFEGGAATNAEDMPHALHHVGLARFYLGDYAAALDAYERALAGFREAGNTRRAVVTLLNVGIVHGSRGDFDRAAECFEEGLKITRAHGDTLQEARILANLGNVHGLRGQFAEARLCYVRSIVILEAAGDARGGAFTWVNIAAIDSLLGDYHEAAAIYSRCVAKFEALNNMRGVAISLNNLGLAYRSLGQYAKAMDVMGRAMEIRRTVGDKAGMASTLRNLGSLQKWLGNYQRALVFHSASLEIAREIGDKSAEAITLSDMGNAYRALDMTDEALRSYEESLSLQTEMDSKSGIAGAHASIGVELMHRGDAESAAAYFRKSIEMHEDMGDAKGVIHPTGNLAYARLRLGEYESALSLAEHALTLARRSGLPENLIEANRVAGAVYFALGRRGDAAARMREAVENIELSRASLTESEHKSGFLGTQLEAYENLVELLLEEAVSEEKEPLANGQLLTANDSAASAEAFGIAERMKARSFLDELGAAKFSRAGVSEELLQEKRLLEARIKWLMEKAGD